LKAHPEYIPKKDSNGEEKEKKVWLFGLGWDQTKWVSKTFPTYVSIKLFMFASGALSESQMVDRGMIVETRGVNTIAVICVAQQNLRKTSMLTNLS
jgi:hypothetical protein